MKRLTPLLFIFLLQGCGYGQYPHLGLRNGKIVDLNRRDTIYTEKPLGDSLPLLNIAVDTSDWHKEDTSKIIMLVSDTKQIDEWFSSYLGVSKPMRDHGVYWQYGYQVYRHREWDYYFLDEDKNRLLKTSIIWQIIKQ